MVRGAVGRGGAFDETLMYEMKQSWAAATVTPYDIYMKTLYELVRDRLDGDDDHEVLGDDEITGKLADFQKVAVRQAVQMIRDWGVAFVADVVGLGKSYVGAAIVKHLRRTNGWRSLIICPAPLVDMWEQYNDVYDLGATVLSTGYIRERIDQNGVMHNLLMEDARYEGRPRAHRRSTTSATPIRSGTGWCSSMSQPADTAASDRNAKEQVGVGRLPPDQALPSDDRTDLPVSPEPEGVFRPGRPRSGKPARAAFARACPTHTKPHPAMVRLRLRDATAGRSFPLRGISPWSPPSLCDGRRSPPVLP